MACPVCGKRIQGENVLWTHVVFKHPDKADSLVLDQSDKIDAENQENRKPFSTTESQANVGATIRPQIQRDNEAKTNDSKTGLNKLVKTRKRAKDKISCESEAPPKKRVKREGHNSIWGGIEKKVDIKVDKEDAKKSLIKREVEKNVTKERRINIKVDDKEVAKRINIEVDEGILDLLMEQKTNELLEEHIKSLENYVEKVFDNMESHRDQEKVFEKDHISELEIDTGLENPFLLPNNQIPEKRQTTMTSPQKRRRITILTPLEKKTTLSTASQRKKTFSPPKRPSLISDSKTSSASGSVHPLNMVTLIM